jgi:predicted GNAT family acetyltransferase
MTTPSLSIEHNVAQQRFETHVDGLLCRCDYRMSGATMLLVHTEVPPRLEGRGIAAALVRAAFEHAAAAGLKVVPACSYVRAYARRHPETQALLA